MDKKRRGSRWTIGEARRAFSELIREAANEPQPIYNRDRLVAALIDAGDFEEFRRWLVERRKQTVAECFAELRQICEEEGYELELPPRKDRENPLIDAAS